MLTVLLATIFTATTTPESGTGAQSDRQVCRETARTGTRFARRVCRSAAEWRALEEQAQRDMGEMRNRPFVNPECRPPSC